MTPWLLSCLLAGWGAVVTSASSSAHRLAGLALASDAPAGPTAGSRAAGAQDNGRVSRAWVVVVLDVSVVVLTLSLLSGLSGVLVAVPAAVGAHRWYTRLPSRALFAQRSAARRELPLVLDLIAAALRTGATTETAVLLAAQAAGPVVAPVLREVVAGLMLGASAEEAWRPALALAGFDRLARAATRSATSGAALRTACSDLARRERRLRHLESQAAVKRAGVWAVLPLALCFLPAFVLLGVVPVVVGLLQSVAL